MLARSVEFRGALGGLLGGHVESAEPLDQGLLVGGAAAQEADQKPLKVTTDICGHWERAKRKIQAAKMEGAFPV